MPSARFTLDLAAPHGAQVSYNGDPVTWPVERVTVFPDDDGPSRHRFTVRGADHAYIQVSFDPDQRDDVVQRVWVESSMDPTLFFLDRPEQWARYASGRVTPGEYPTRFVPTVMTAADAYAALTAAIG